MNVFVSFCDYCREAHQFPTAEARLAWEIKHNHNGEVVNDS